MSLQLDIKEMLRRYWGVIKTGFLIKSTRYYFCMEAPKEIKVVDFEKEQYGDYPFIRSAFRSERKWTPLSEVNQTLQGSKVLVRARIHNIRGKGNNCFIVLRENFYTLQACAFKSETIEKEMIKYMSSVPNESIVDIVGTVVIPQKPIESCTQQVQLQIQNFYVVNRAANRLPLQIVDASRKVQHNQFDPDEEDTIKQRIQEKIEAMKGEKKEEAPKKEEVPPKKEEIVEKKEEVKEETDKEVKEEAQKEVKEEANKETEVKQETGEKKEGEAKEGEKKKKQKKEKKKKEEKKVEQEKKDQAPIVKMKTRLDNRVIDIRTPAKQAIFKLSSGICQLFREFLLDRDFVQIHSPKLIGGSSEGGSNVFHLSYFGTKACLAQSPQLYKQMCVMGDFQRVFEIGPVFRAENSFTHRHMCEFVGLDIEMTIKEHYFEVLEFYGELFPYIFENIEKRYQKELKAINEQFQFTPFKCKTPVVKLTFAEGIALLKENGIDWPADQDLSTEVEKKLGQFVRNKYDTDFYMLHRYPASARPFYTMLCHDDPNLTCSYDFFMRGEQILSGAQRIHDPEVLKERAIAKGIDPSTISDYIECFQYGAYPHGGGGIGLERVVMLFCALKNIRNASLFPRDPHRITP